MVILEFAIEYPTYLIVLVWDEIYIHVMMIIILRSSPDNTRNDEHRRLVLKELNRFPTESGICSPRLFPHN